MSKTKKSIIAISIVVVTIGIIIGGVFGGIAIANNVKWKNKQGYDTSLVWVNINNMLAEPKHIENDTYNYENYIVEVPNTTQLSVLSYKIGKDATGEFYYDSECENEIEDIKNIDASDELYSKTIYLKIVSQRKEERVVKIDIDIDEYLIEGTERKDNTGGHIEIPSDLTEITLDSVPYKVIRQSNIQALYTANDKENFLLAEDIFVQQLIPQISIFDGNNYEISLDEKANYMTNYEEELRRGEPHHTPDITYIRNFECVIQRAATVKNINYIGFPDRLITFVKSCNNAYQIKVKNATICDYMAGSRDYNKLTDFKNNLIIQESGSNRGMLQFASGVLIFNCINYTETGATLAVIQAQNIPGVPKEEQRYIFFGSSGGISNLAEASKIINCYNFLDTAHGWSSSGIVACASGAIIRCNNYGNIELNSSPSPSTPAYPHRYIETRFPDAHYFGAGGIVISMKNLNHYFVGNEELEIKRQQIIDCSNYGNIYYHKKIVKDIKIGGDQATRMKYENIDKDDIGQIIESISNNDGIRNCKEYGKIIKR